MGQITTTDFTGQQLALMQKTVAKDCTPGEFDLFINMARAHGLDPFRREIYAIVTNKNKPDKRQLVVVTGIDGLRRKAAQSGDYCPDDDEPEFTIRDELKDPKTNPLGIEKCKVRAYKGDRRIVGVAYWEEFAPLREKWGEREDGSRGPSGEFELDPNKQNWRKMARLMLAKCAEAQALRKGWPAQISGLYEQSELDQAAIDLSPSEWAEKTDADERLKRIGGRHSAPIQWKVGDLVKLVPMGEVADAVVAHLRDIGSAAELEWWRRTNAEGLRAFWAHAPGDALDVKKAIEQRHAELETAVTEAA
jgi:phage recombination protein Bet